LPCTVAMAIGVQMRQINKPDTHTEAALYWSAVSLMVCEGLPLEEAASQLGVEDQDLRVILQHRATSAPFDCLQPPQAAEPADSAEREATYC
jgi:hypothetical protein